MQLAFEQCTLPTSYLSFLTLWTVNVPAFTFATEASLTMFAAGKPTGLSVNCGYSVTSVTPVYEGRILPSSTPPSSRLMILR